MSRSQRIRLNAPESTALMTLKSRPAVLAAHLMHLPVGAESRSCSALRMARGSDGQERRGGEQNPGPGGPPADGMHGVFLVLVEGSTDPAYAHARKCKR